MHRTLQEAIEMTFNVVLYILPSFRRAICQVDLLQEAFLRQITQHDGIPRAENGLDAQRNAGQTLRSRSGVK